MDADERLTPELASEIRGTVDRDDPSRDAYGVRATIFFLGRPIRHSGGTIMLADPAVSPRRLPRRLRQGPRAIGCAARQGGNAPGQAPPLYVPLSAQWTEKQNRYTTLWAEDKHAAGRRTSWLGILIRPAGGFFRAYFFRAGFLDGTAGFDLCLSCTFYTFLKYAKLWHLNHDVQR